MNVFCRATPVTMPGRAIGSTNRNEYVLRPKKRKRCMAKAASVPSTRAIAVAASADLHGVPQRLARALGLPRLLPPVDGQPLAAATTSDVAVLNDRIATTSEREVQEHERDHHHTPRSVSAGAGQRDSRIDAHSALERADAAHGQEVDDDDQQRPQRVRGGERLVRREQRAVDDVADHRHLPLGDEARR